MKIFVKAKTSSKKEKIEKINENTFIVKVKELPIDDKANKAIIKKLSGHFKIPINQIKIISGHITKTKIIEIINN
ncbi:MAG: DUF167 domain-containing protein [Patescibacteria group bacterium]|nr:DUF167 domain-containing protein [Patescibacteria group bacterium]